MWQPIETAPKDREIDVWAVTTDDFGRLVNACRHADVLWCETEDGEGWHYPHAVWDRILIDSSWSGGNIVVTHWMPTPAPPN